MNENSKKLKDFTKYCAEHPSERFWQALRNWSGQAFILAVKSEPKLTEREIDSNNVEDTFYWT